jgi:Histidine kinase-, DNA gyrase B-, and HSP90-like ATPase
MEDFYADLATASLEDPKDFAESVLQIAQDSLDLAAGSFYLYTPETEMLRLKAQVGFSLTDYEDFQLSLDSFAGEAIRAGKIVVEADPMSSSLFREKKVLNAVRVGGLVAAPLSLANPPEYRVHRLIASPDPLGAICLYPRDPATLPVLVDWIGRYAPFLARLYLATLERYAMYFRSVTVEQVAFRRDVGSLAHAFLDLLCKEMDVKTGALWVFDHVRGHLYLRRSHGDYANVKDRDVKPVVLGDDGVIDRCFTEGEVITHSRVRPTFGSSNLPEGVKTPSSNAAVFPIPLPEEARLGGERAPTVGVLALIDNQTTIKGTAHLTDFSWEDSFLAEFGCEMLSVLLYQALRTRDYESDYERRMHGASTALHAARSNLQHLVERTDIAVHLPGAQSHSIPNAIEWIEDLEAQIARNDVFAEDLQIETVKLYGDVLAKLRPMVRRLTLGDEFDVLGLDELDASYHRLPEVLGNRRALDRVCRNLVENSLKYQVNDADHPNRIYIRAYGEKERVILHIEDNGFGIASRDAPQVFEDGFRGAEARGRKPQGLGRGLFECKTILTKLGGDIALTEAERLSGAAFRIELKAAAGRRSGGEGR